MTWTDAWIGLRYTARGRGPAYDCLGLFLALQRVRKGRELPDPLCTMTSALREDLARQHLIEGHDWRPVQRAQEGDALLFRLGRRPLHIAYAVDARTMLHIETDGAGSCVEDFTGPRWRGQLQGIYRLV